MNDLFPARWTVEHPDRIQLYSLATPNGKKAGIMLEESGLPYEAHKVNIMAGDQFEEDYVRINPNSKIPTIIDPSGPNGSPIAIMESGAILTYLAEKSGKLLPADPELRIQVNQWLYFQVGSVGPMFGQFGHFFKFAKDKTTDTYAVERYTKESNRLLGVLDRRLEGRDYLVGDDYSIADVAIFPWLQALDFYEGKEALEYSSFANLEPWVQRCATRPATERGLKVTGFGD